MSPDPNPAPSFAPTSVVYGAPSPELVEAGADAVQTSPLVPGSTALEALAPESLERAVMAAPPGTLERRHVLALALRALKPGGELIVLAPKDRGGARLGSELTGFGCEVEETGRRHQRICRVLRPDTPEGIEAAMAAGGPQRLAGLDLWTQPGVFSWDRPDPGTQLLIQHLPGFSGVGADLGCGLGQIARAVLASPAVTEMTLVDIDRRAIDAAARNVTDPRARLVWGDGRVTPELSGLDFVVMNPPFHDAGVESRGLGVAFVTRAAALLRKGGVLWLVANRHLPYEESLTRLFTRVAPAREASGFKVYEARK
jgi:16S rRNA (guanine1207-N2)-methyltransferase